MTQRRSLSTALEISPEKLAFIEGAAPHSPPPSSSVDADAPRITERAKRPSRTRLAQQHNHSESTEPSLVGTLLVPLTTRLQTQTADGLRRAYLERKLRGRRPNTQQEIIEEALQVWLRNEGYL
jgi:hypothetical protein